MSLTTFFSEPAPSLFIIANSCMWPDWTTDQKEENMDTVTQDRITGIDVSRDWLDVHCLPDGQRLRLSNTDEGHTTLVDLAHSIGALVYFKATEGQEWRLWSTLEATGIARGNCRLRKSKPSRPAGKCHDAEGSDVEEHLKNLGLPAWSGRFGPNDKGTRRCPNR
tara:strand:- start:8 stop:502 length:495 start_codon:yes stop_codon:yes gene_type:complete